MNKFKLKLYQEYEEHRQKVKEIKVSGNKLPKYYKMYDEKESNIGWINMKYEKFQNRYLKGVSTFIITRDENVIIELRSKDCNMTPSQRDLCSGHTDENENSNETAYREMQEELGIQKNQVEMFKKIEEYIPLTFGEDRKFFIQFNVAIGNFSIEQIKGNIQKTEVEDVIEIPMRDCFELIRNGNTKFPYKYSEEKFEKVFKQVESTYQEYIGQIQSGEIEK